MFLLWFPNALCSISFWYVLGGSFCASVFSSHALFVFCYVSYNCSLLLFACCRLLSRACACAVRAHVPRASELSVFGFQNWAYSAFLKNILQFIWFFAITRSTKVSGRISSHSCNWNWAYSALRNEPIKLSSSRIRSLLGWISSGWAYSASGRISSVHFFSAVVALLLAGVCADAIWAYSAWSETRKKQPNKLTCWAYSVW